MQENFPLVKTTVLHVGIFGLGLGLGLLDPSRDTLLGVLPPVPPKYSDMAKERYMSEFLGGSREMKSVGK